MYNKSVLYVMNGGGPLCFNIATEYGQSLFIWLTHLCEKKMKNTKRRKAERKTKFIEHIETVVSTTLTDSTSKLILHTKHHAHVHTSTTATI